MHMLDRCCPEQDIEADLKERYRVNAKSNRVATHSGEQDPTIGVFTKAQGNTIRVEEEKKKSLFIDELIWPHFVLSFKLTLSYSSNDLNLHEL